MNLEQTGRAAACVIAAGILVPSAEAATPVEGYHDRDDRVACVMYQGYDRHGNAVACGRRSGGRGLMLRSAGRASDRSWTWPASTLGDSFFTAPYGRTLYLYGGTAKVQGDASVLRCTFKKRPSVRVRCRNGDGFGLLVTRKRVTRVPR